MATTPPAKIPQACPNVREGAAGVATLPRRMATPLAGKTLDLPEAAVLERRRSAGAGPASREGWDLVDMKRHLLPRDSLPQLHPRTCEEREVAQASDINKVGSV